MFTIEKCSTKEKNKVPIFYVDWKGNLLKSFIMLIISNTCFTRINNKLRNINCIITVNYNILVVFSKLFEDST